MRKILILLFPVIVFSQSTIDVSIFQDYTLAFFNDDHGNKAFTPDLRFEVMMNGKTKQRGNTWWTIGLTYEYAELYGGTFRRGGFQFGLQNRWYFDGFWFIPELGYYQTTFLIGYSGITRRGDNKIHDSFEITFEIDIRISETISIPVKFVKMQRGDLGKFDDPTATLNPFKWQPGGYIGIEYRIKTQSRRK